ncbi:MAG: hypothetical protein Q8S13_02585 [Dehalococcoidia bacterium]|nr:hypothetical protein [Dehalococcoidia bacterium]
MPASAPLLEALCWHEAFRRLGYLPSEIFVAYVENGTDPDSGYSGPGVAVVLRYAGKQYAVIVPDPKLEALAEGSAEDVDRRFVAAWSPATAWWNSAQHEELTPIWEKSRPVCNGTLLVMSLTARGIYPLERVPE